MRMIGIGLMGFLLAGIALLLSTMNILEQGQAYVRTFTSGPHLVFEHRNPATAQDGYEAVIVRANPDYPVILSGLPAYQSVAFILPVDARPTSGYLQIDATSQVLDGVEGVLRISIHNTRRGEMLLRSGEAGRSLQIPLSPTDFAGSKLVVSFSLQGTGPHHQCGPEDGVEAVVEIETTSAVYLTLDRPLQSTRDRIHAWGRVARVAWPHWLKPEEQVRRLVLATQVQRRGLATVFDTAQSADALTTLDLRAALAAFPQSDPEPHFNGALAHTGANAGVRRFHRQAVWRERYSLGGDAEQRLPDQLDLHMQFGRLMGSDHWALTVTLNNRLVFQAHLSGTQTHYQAQIELSSDMQAADNVLEVVATTTASQDGVCDRGPELVAEMLRTSRLVVGDTPVSYPLSDVHEALGAVGAISVATGGNLPALDADAASHMLNKVLPTGAVFKPAGKQTHVTVLGPDATLPDLPRAGPIWLVAHDQTSGKLSARSVKAGDALSRTGIALLITPNAIALPEAEG